MDTETRDRRLLTRVWDSVQNIGGYEGSKAVAGRECFQAASVDGDTVLILLRVPSDENTWRRNVLRTIKETLKERRIMPERVEWDTSRDSTSCGYGWMVIRARARSNTGPMG